MSTGFRLPFPPAAWGLVALFVLCNVLFVVMSAPHTLVQGTGEIALLGSTAGAVALVAGDGRRPSRGTTTFILGAVLVTTIANESTLADADPLGYESWHFGACTVLLLTLAVRGRVLMAWCGMAALIVVTALWAVHIGRSPWYAVTLTTWHMGVLVIGTTVGLGLGLLQQRLDRVRIAASARATAEDVATAAQRESRARAETILQRVEPVLEVVASAGELTEEDRTRARLLEAALRDEMRAPSLVREGVFVAALDHARRTGQDVLLLDDADESEEAQRQRSVLTRRLAPRIAVVPDAQITIRFSGQTGRYRLTLVSASHSETFTLGAEDTLMPPS